MIALGRSRNPSSRSSRDGPFTITGVTFIVCYLLLNCQIRGKKGNTCAQRLESVSHSVRHWLDAYKAAIMEFDRAKLPASIDAAESLNARRKWTPHSEHLMPTRIAIVTELWHERG